MIATLNIIFIFLLGLIFGSFSNVLVDRTQAGKSILGRSICDKCKRQLKWWENIPVLSFLFLGGRCRTCKTKLSWQYPIVEFSMGVLFVLAAWRGGLIGGEVSSETFVKTSYFICFSSVLFLILLWDLKYMIIPDGLVLSALIFVVINLILQVVLFGESLQFLFWHLCGMVAVFGFFYLMFFFSKGKWIGGGDVKLGIPLGLAFGLKMAYPFLLFAYTIGALVSLPLLLKGKKKMKSQIPFGPFLVVSALIILFFGEKMIEWVW